MPRSRGSEMPHRQSPRGTHAHRTPSTESDTLHHRAVTERSPKIGERRSPRGLQPDQKKFGSRIADLESQLAQAQDELKVLKNQLASAEAAKKEAQQQLENKNKKLVIPDPEETREKHSSLEVHDSHHINSEIVDEAADEIHEETDVFEVPLEKKIAPDCHSRQVGDLNEGFVVPPDAASCYELPLKDAEINMLKAKLDEKMKELEVQKNENENLKKELGDATIDHASAKAKEEEMSATLSQLKDELKASKTDAVDLKGKLDAAEGATEALEAEMRKMRVQTEQWRKAADAAAAVLSGGMETNSRISGRCSSMDKNFGGMFDTPSSQYTGFVGSPGIADESNDGFRSSKQRSSSGMKVFGDLWKRKAQK